MTKVKTKDFLAQVRQEVSKVTWPSRKEVMVSMVMVFVMVSLASLFFFAVDAIVFNAVQFILGLGS